MRTVVYAIFLVVLLAGALLVVRSLKPEPEEASLPKRLATLREAGGEDIDLTRLAGATPAELVELGNDYYQFWRVREATRLLEQAVRTDSTLHGAWMKLVECYSHPLVANEQGVLHALERARLTVAAPADTQAVDALRMLYADVDYAGAVAAFSAMLRARPTDSEARYQLSLAYFLLGRLEDCEKQLAPLLKADATVGPVAELNIRRLAAARDLSRAAGAARELARLYSEESHPYVLIAQVELARGNRDVAAEFCSNALSIDPRCVPAILTRALLYAEEGEFEAARVSCEKLSIFDDTILQSIGHEGTAYVDFLAGDFEAGVDEMDESIRHAMMTGSTRRGLTLAARLVDELCQLGQAERAEAVVERWVSGFGEVPVRLVRARIQILRGDFESANDVLAHLESDKEWVLTARALGIEPTELAALAEVGRQRQTQALALLSSDGKGNTAVAAGAASRRAFLTGYASFENGDAESAAVAFAAVRQRQYGLEFPYHGDPVLSVQSLFFLAESDLARGGHAAARESYEAFVGFWGEAAWDLEAVARARKKLEALGSAEAVPQG